MSCNKMVDGKYMLFVVQLLILAMSSYLVVVTEGLIKYVFYFLIIVSTWCICNNYLDEKMKREG